MFYLMSKDEEFIAFKAYQAWAERQTGTKLKCKWTDWGGEFLSDEHKMYLKENWTSDISAWLTTTKWTSRKVPTNHSQWSTEAMWHHAGLSDRFWIHTVKVKVHTYNITLIKRASYKTPTELFRGLNPDISPMSLWLPSLDTHFEKEDIKTWAKKPRNDLCQLWTGIQGIPVLGHSPPMFQNILWCEIWFPVKELKLTQ